MTGNTTGNTPGAVTRATAVRDRDAACTRIGFLLIPDFSMMALISALEPLRSANYVAGRPIYDWTLITPDGRPARANSGIEMTPVKSIAEFDFHPFVLVCASIDGQWFDDRATFAWLRSLDRHGARIGAISTGSYPLARAGLLDGYRCTIHWEFLTSFTEDFPELEVTGRLFEIDGSRVTAAGGSATFDLMLHLIAEEHGHDLAAAVAEQLIHPMPDEPDAPQRLPLTQRLRISHPKLITIIEMMEKNLEEPLSRERLAMQVDLSTRQVERLFTKYLGKSPARYYLELRLKRAHLLLCQTSMSILDVSVACGFVSASHFSKCYREMFGHPPRFERTPRPSAIAS